MLLYVEVGPNDCNILLTDREKRYCSSAASDLETSLRDLLQKKKPRRTFLILSAEKAVLRFASVSALSKKELDKAVLFLYDDLFPPPKAQYIFGYRVIHTSNGVADLLMAAVPAVIARDYAALFRRLGIRLHDIELLETAAGNVFMPAEQALLFTKQESTIRVIWPFQDAWRISDAALEGVWELRLALAGLEGAAQISRCVFYGPADDWLMDECQRLELSVGDPLEPYTVLDHYAASKMGGLIRL